MIKPIVNLLKEVSERIYKIDQSVKYQILNLQKKKNIKDKVES